MLSKFVVFGGVLLLCGCGEQKQNHPKSKPTFKLSDVLPSSTCNVEPMKVVFSDRATELTSKLQAAAASKPDWWLNHVKNAKAGEPLPFHTNLGLTEAEYSEYLAEVAKRKLVPSDRKVSIGFWRNRDFLEIRTGGQTPLDKLWLNVKTGKLMVAGREIPGPEWQTSEREDIPTGPWEGYSWKFESGDLDVFTVRVVSLELLRLKRTGKILWIFKDQRMVEKESKRNFEVVFQHSPGCRD